MTQRGALRDYVLMIEPGSEQLVNAIGDYFRVTSADGGRVKVSTSKGDSFDVQEGEGAKVRDFETLRIRNDSSIALRVRMLVGSGEFQSARTSGSVSVNPGATIQAVGDYVGGDTIPANPNRQQMIMRADTNNAGDLTIAGLPMQPGDILELNITGGVTIGGDGTDTLHVAEII